MNTQQVYTSLVRSGWKELSENTYVKGDRVSVVTSWEEGKVSLYTFEWVYDARGYALADVYKGSEFKRAARVFSLKIPMNPEGRRTGNVWKHTRKDSEGRHYGVASGRVRLEVEKEVCKALSRGV